MIIDNVMYNNIDGIIEKPYGKMLLRYPENLIEKMNPVARHMARYACNAEIRFVTEAPTCFVSLMSEKGIARVMVYYGDYAVAEHSLPEGKITKIALDVPSVIANLGEDFYEGSMFSKNVWRLHLHGTISVCGIDTMNFAVRPPKKEEMPGKTMLSYGSSISHGAGTTYMPMCYVKTLSRLLGVDCIAKGVGGSCFLEPEIADSFAARSDWDFALLELGVNMVDDFETPEFEKRFIYFADKMYSTGKKLIFTTIYPNYAFFKDDAKHQRTLEFCDVIRKKCSEFDKSRVLLVEGKDVVTKTQMLTADGIHPSTEGHVAMGYNLYEKVKEFFK